MASGAGLVDLIVVQNSARKLEGRVAAGAIIADINVVNRLARSGHTVVAGRTDTDNLSVVHPSILKACCDVAIIAAVAGGDMVRRLGTRLAAVMAGRAFLINPNVIKGEGHEIAGGMTIRTIIASRRVRCRLTRSNPAIVTGHTVARRSF